MTAQQFSGGLSTSALLELAMTAPRTALAAATELLSVAAAPSERSQLWRAIGNAHRELANTRESVECLDHARQEANLSADRHLIALAELSWAGTGSYAGTVAESVELCWGAIATLAGTPDEAIAWHQLAGVLGRQDKYAEALAAGDEGLARLDGSGSVLAAEIHQNAALTLVYLGRYDEAIERAERALARYEAAGWEKRVADVEHNLGWLAARQGDIGRANQLLQAAERRYASGVQRDVHGGLWVDRAEASGLAGLWAEAHEMLGRHANELEAAGNAMDAADARLQRAKVALRLGRLNEAAKDADRAATAYALPNVQRWPWWGAATIVATRARRQLVGLSRDDVTDCLLAIDRVRDALPSDWVDGNLLLADMALDRGDLGEARDRLSTASSAATTALDDVAIAAVRARLERLAARPDAGLAACRSGLGALARLRSTTGSLDLQAHVGAHASRLTDEGLGLALASNDVGLVFEWVEWRRGVALSMPPARVGRDAQLVRDTNRLRELEAAGAPVTAEAAALADQITRRARRIGGVSWVVDPPDVTRLQGAIGNRTFVHLFTADDTLHALVTTAGRSELLALGAESELRREARHLMSSVRRALHRRPTSAVVERLRVEAGRLDDQLGRLRECWGAEVILCPPPDLAGIPWGLLPSLAAQSIALAPTARVLGRRPRPCSGVVLVAGPNLAWADREIAELKALHPNSLVLTGANATAEAVLASIDGAELVHFSCHGTFNPANPLFSSLALADGPLYGYDLASVDRAPTIVSMAACEAGQSQNAGVEDVLGLSTVLLAAGTIAVLAARPAVPDSADTVAVSIGVHRALIEGSSLSAALRAVRVEIPLVGAAFDVIGDDVTFSGRASLSS